MSHVVVTEDVITVPIPEALAADFVMHESYRLPGKREVFELTLGDHDLGLWRIEAIASQINGGSPRMVATLRRAIQ